MMPLEESFWCGDVRVEYFYDNPMLRVEISTPLNNPTSGVSVDVTGFRSESKVSDLEDWEVKPKALEIAIEMMDQATDVISRMNQELSRAKRSLA